MAIRSQDLRTPPSVEVVVDQDDTEEVNTVPDRYQKSKKQKAMLGSSLYQSRQLDYTTTDYADSIQGTETDTEA